MADIIVSSNVDSILQSANYAAIKALLSLNNLDNTSDVNKPVSTAGQTALNLKANLSGGNTLVGNQAVTGDITASGTLTLSSLLNVMGTLMGSGGVVFASNGEFTVGASSDFYVKTGSTTRATINSTQASFAVPISAGNITTSGTLLVNNATPRVALKNTSAFNDLGLNFLNPSDLDIGSMLIDGVNGDLKLSPYNAMNALRISATSGNITASGSVTGLDVRATEGALYLQRSGGNEWLLYTLGSNTAYLRDMTNSRMQVSYLGGANSAAAVTQFHSNVTVDSNITASGSVKTGIKTIATLPSAASSTGERYQVSDSATVVNRLVFSNGTAWYYEGTAVAV